MWARGKLYSPVIRSQSFDEPVSVNFTSTSQLSSHLRWDRMARRGWNWVFPFPWVDKALKKLQLGFVKQIFKSPGIVKNRMLWCISK